MAPSIVDAADPRAAAGAERIIIDPGTPLGQGQQRGGGQLTRRHVLAATASVAGLVGCCVLAAVIASADGSGEELAVVGGDAAARRASEQDPYEDRCRVVQPGEPCHRRIMWAMTHDLAEFSKRYPGLTEKSTVEDFQAALASDPFVDCPAPCGAAARAAEEALAAKGTAVGAATATDPDTSGQINMAPMLGWQPSGRVVAQGQWCSAQEPQPGWALQSCGAPELLVDAATGKSTYSPIAVKVLTYNLFWWSLFDRRRSAGGSAGKLIGWTAQFQQFDMMGFQECENVWWVLTDSGYAHEYDAITGPHALCIAYRKTVWNKISDSSQNIAEDRWDQWYGTRAGMWGRFNHTETGQVVFFINHHGPLPLNSGGRCGGEATAYNLLELIAREGQPGDVIILVGDFNAGPNSQTLLNLRGRLHNVFTGTSFGGVDNILSSCANVTWTRNLGPGGSDHDALEAVIQL